MENILQEANELLAIFVTSQMTAKGIAHKFVNS